MCTLYCSEGELTVIGRVGNQGYAPVFKGVEIVLYAETSAGDLELARMNLSGGIKSGELRENFTFELTGVDTSAILDLRVEVDGGNAAVDDGAYTECDENNNESNWGKPVCN